jgi:hypothetical protein
MARIRTIKPEFFSHEELASKTPYARLLAIGLLTLADCEGRLRWVPMQVHSQVFPWEASVNIQSLLSELIECDYLVHYEVDGKQYVEIVNFKKHQRISGKEATYSSRIPSPPKKTETANKNKGQTSEATGKNPGDSQGSDGNPLGTGEHRNRGTGEQGNTLSLPAGDDSEIRIPSVLKDSWTRWKLFMLERHGIKIGQIEAEANLKDLLDRGADKANLDIEFSIKKGAKSILDSSNDYQKRTGSNGGSKPQTELDPESMFAS